MFDFTGDKSHSSPYLTLWVEVSRKGAVVAFGIPQVTGCEELQILKEAGVADEIESLVNCAEQYLDVLRAYHSPAGNGNGRALLTALDTHSDLVDLPLTAIQKEALRRTAEECISAGDWKFLSYLVHGLEAEAGDDFKTLAIIKSEDRPNVQRYLLQHVLELVGTWEFSTSTYVLAGDVLKELAAHVALDSDVTAALSSIHTPFVADSAPLSDLNDALAALDKKNFVFKQFAKSAFGAAALAFASEVRLRRAKISTAFVELQALVLCAPSSEGVLVQASYLRWKFGCEKGSRRIITPTPLRDFFASYP